MDDPVWSEVRPCLWIGGHTRFDATGEVPVVVARTLVELGLGVAEAIALVRTRHSPRVLHNELSLRHLPNEPAR